MHCRRLAQYNNFASRSASLRSFLSADRRINRKPTGVGDQNPFSEWFQEVVKVNYVRLDVADALTLGGLSTLTVDLAGLATTGTASTAPAE
jgi:hypothetical protein